MTDPPPRPTRRDALGLLFVGGLGVLAVACSSGTSETTTPTTTATTPGGSSGTSGTPLATAPAGTTGTTVGATTVDCVLTPEVTEGPYWIDDALERRDITEGRPGVPLALELTVADATSCSTIADAVVDVWHCDAGGTYSGFVSTETGAPRGPGGPGGRGGGGGGVSADDTRFLRGIQRTDASGVARFTTIVPGWYQGRAVHIHVKVSVGGDEVHTGQLFFAEPILDEVMAQAPYTDHRGQRLRNEDDGIFRQDDGLLVTMTEQGDGYLGRQTLGVRPGGTAGSADSAGSAG